MPGTRGRVRKGFGTGRRGRTGRLIAQNVRLSPATISHILRGRGLWPPLADGLGRDQQMDRDRRKGMDRILLPVLVGCTMLAMGAFTLMLPSLPQIGREFGVSPSSVLTLQAGYLIGLAVPQLFFGYISDRIGRRLPLLFGIFVFALGSALSAGASSFIGLAVGRTIQAVGASAGLALARVIVRDLYSRDEAASRLAYVTTAMVVAPMLAPLFGGMLEEHYGWRASFIVATTFALLLLIMAAVSVRETATPWQRRSADGSPAGFSKLLRNREFLLYAGQTALGSSGFHVFLAAAPFVIVSSMEVSPSEFGLWFLLPAGSYMLGNFLCGRFGMRIGTERLIDTALVLQGLSVATLFFLDFADALIPSILFTVISLYNFGNGLMLPGTIATAVGAVPGASGRAAGLSGFLQMVCSGAAAAAIGALITANEWAMIAGLGLTVTLGAILRFTARSTIQASALFEARCNPKQPMPANDSLTRCSPHDN